MRNLFLLLSAIVLIAISSCSKTDEPSTRVDNPSPTHTTLEIAYKKAISLLRMQFGEKWATYSYTIKHNGLVYE